MADARSEKKDETNVHTVGRTHRLHCIALQRHAISAAPQRALSSSSSSSLFPFLFVRFDCVGRWKKAGLPLPPKFTESGDSYTIRANKVHKSMHLQAAKSASGPGAAAATGLSDLISHPSTDDELMPTAPTTPAHSASVATTTPPLSVASYASPSLAPMTQQDAGAGQSTLPMEWMDKSATSMEMQQRVQQAAMVANSPAAFGVATLSALSADGLGGKADTPLPTSLRSVMALLHPSSSSHFPAARYPFNPYSAVFDGSGPIFHTQLQQLQNECTHEGSDGPAAVPTGRDSSSLSHSQSAASHLLPPSFHHHSLAGIPAHSNPIGDSAAAASLHAVSLSQLQLQLQADRQCQSALTAATPDPLALPSTFAGLSAAASTSAGHAAAVVRTVAGNSFASCAGGDGCAGAHASADADRRRASRAVPVASRASERLRGRPPPPPPPLPQPSQPQLSDHDRGDEIEQ